MECHQAQVGETLETIKSMYGQDYVSVAPLGNENSDDTVAVRPGMQIPIYRGCIWEPYEHICYKILKNDTMDKIAADFAVSVSELSSYNDVLNPDRIYHGYWLAIPVNIFAASATSAARGQDRAFKQSKFEALAELALKAGVDADAVAALRARSD
jgi:hypothetical protein